MQVMRRFSTKVQVKDTYSLALTYSQNSEDERPRRHSDKSLALYNKEKWSFQYGY